MNNKTLSAIVSILILSAGCKKTTFDTKQELCSYIIAECKSSCNYKLPENFDELAAEGCNLKLPNSNINEISSKIDEEIKQCVPLCNAFYETGLFNREKTHPFLEDDAKLWQKFREKEAKEKKEISDLVSFYKSDKFQQVLFYTLMQQNKTLEENRDNCIDLYVSYGLGYADQIKFQVLVEKKPLFVLVYNIENYRIKSVELKKDEIENAFASFNQGDAIYAVQNNKPKMDLIVNPKLKDKFEQAKRF